MKKKSSFTHPRQLTLERSEPPALPGILDTVYYNGIFKFNISALLKWLKQHPQPITQVPVNIWYSVEREDDVDLNQPVIVAEIAPDYRDFVPSFSEHDWYARGYVCIEGTGRIAKARRLGMETVPAIILRMEQHIPFLYSGYEQYVSYWNDKLVDRARDAQFWSKNSQ